MILREFVCLNGHGFEASLRNMASENPSCAECGAATRQRYVRVGLGGVADAGTPQERMPTSWTGVRGGEPSTVAGLHAVAKKRQKLEEKYPELAGDRRPILSHEGLFAKKPLRAGDDISKAISDAVGANKRSKDQDR